MFPPEKGRACGKGNGEWVMAREGQVLLERSNKSYVRYLVVVETGLLSKDITPVSDIPMPVASNKNMSK